MIKERKEYARTSGPYNGWANRQTWNVSLWLNNEEWMYLAAVRFMQTHGNGPAPYVRFIKSMGMENNKTPDRYKWLSQELSYKELNEMMRELTS